MDWDKPWLRQWVSPIANGKKRGKGGGRPEADDDTTRAARAPPGALLFWLDTKQLSMYQCRAMKAAGEATI
eukprot:5247828-Pyramimonas_sp.AAC.1